MKTLNNHLSIVSLLLFISSLIGIISPASARVIACSTLSGAGTYLNPFQIGIITESTAISNCSPLTSGKGFNTKYFSFALAKPAPSKSFVGMISVLNANQRSVVHPGLINPNNGFKIADSMGDGFWLGRYRDIGVNIRLLNLSPLKRSNQALPKGNWLLRAGKLDSPLRSTTTPNYHFLIFLPE